MTETYMTDAEKLLRRQQTANSFISVRETLSVATGSWENKWQLNLKPNLSMKLRRYVITSRRLLF